MTCDTETSEQRTATFYGGVAAFSELEEQFAYGIGAALGQAGYALHHGGYNGLMEAAARGAATAGVPIVAVTLASADWGAFNPYVTNAEQLPTMGKRLHRFLDDTDIVVAMGGGIGTLHELTAALWYAGNVRAVPVVLAGSTVLRLIEFLKSERWLYESPTRPLNFLRETPDLASFKEELYALKAHSGHAKMPNPAARNR